MPSDIEGERDTYVDLESLETCAGALDDVLAAQASLIRVLSV